MRRRFRQSFPYRYEVLDYSHGYDPRDPNLASFYDVENVVMVLSDCLHDVGDMLLMTEMLQKHHMFDPLTCWQDVQVLDRFAALVFSGRVVLRKPEPEKRRFAPTRPTVKVEEAPAQRPAEEPMGRAWVEVELVDIDDKPVANARCEVRALNEYRQRSSRLNDNGFRRFEALKDEEDGCLICFPSHASFDWSLDGEEPEDPPDTGKIHRVRDGQSVASIAQLYHVHNWEKIWEHAKNEALREKRDQDPNTLAAGDRLFVPRHDSKTVQVALNKKHRFKLFAKPCLLELVLYDEKREPLANAEYELELTLPRGCTKFEQQETQTDGDGKISETIPAAASAAKIVFPATGHEFTVRLSRLTPLDLDDESTLIRGVQQRLSAAGFLAGPADGVLGPLTRNAVRRFQKFCQDSGDARASDCGEVDGVVGPKTKDACFAYFGC